MATLGNPQSTAEILKKYNFEFHKKLGQNFLIDSHVIDKIIETSGVTKDDCVLEIGPGIGTLTQYLAENACRVVAVEIDTKLMPVLNETLAGYDNVTVINKDILKTDIRALADEYNGGKAFKVVANLPYYITTPIIMELLEKALPIENITVMVQKEIALRMQAGPGSKDYGALSLFVQYYAKPYLAANVPANCFIPRPGVDSALIRLTGYDKPPVEVMDEQLMFRLIRAAFNQRRKTLYNSLSNSPDIPYSKEMIAQVIKDLGYPAAVRGEALTLEGFAALADELVKLDTDVEDIDAI